MDTEGLVAEAFEHLGIDVRLCADADLGVDLMLDPEGVAIPIELERRSLVTEDVARQLLAMTRPAGSVLLVVADRVTQAARAILVSNRSGYLDLRGRVALRSEGLVINAQVEPVMARGERAEAFGGKAGLEVATAVLMRPERPVAVRELARELGRSPSTVSEVLAALRRDGLLDAANAVEGTDLFWRVADRWPVERTSLGSLPALGDVSRTDPLRLALHDVGRGPGWALTDTAAAAAYGAPVAFRSDQVLDFYVPDQSIVRRATTLLGVAASTVQARSTVRIAPVPAAVRDRVDVDRNPTEWPLAHPLFVALDLAQDAGRGREILDAWTPDARWPRVW